jgi:glucokinase
VIVLAGDVGGTTCRLALLALDAAPPPAPGGGTALACRLLFRRDYPSAAHASLQGVLARFRDDLPAGLPAAVAAGFGVPGPVVEGVCRTTNLPWVVARADLRRALALDDVALVNDFHAAALGVTTLDAAACVQIGGGAPIAGGPIALLGAGTGLGEAYLHHVGGRYEVLPSEGGHKDFAPHDDEEIALLRWLLRRHAHVSWERVVCGPGLVTLYEFYRDELGVPDGPGARAALAAAADPAPVVTRGALDGADPAAVRALDRFCRLYGAEAGNLALAVVATGGVYLAGGVTPNIVDALRAGPFRAAFEEKGRYRELLEAIPVRVVVDEHLGLRGAALAAARLLNGEPDRPRAGEAA